MPTLRVALAQLNLTVGDLEANGLRIAEAIVHAKAWRADLVVVPELAVTGYPPEDLLLKPAFVQANLQALARLPALTQGLTALVGFVDRDRQGRLFNAAAVLAGGRHVATYHKQRLPNYGVFDEPRYFTPGASPLVLSLQGVRVGLTICEDLWQEAPARVVAAAGCRLLVNLSASPYHAGKLAARQALCALRAKTHRLAVAYCNLVGGQDELVFDGASLILEASGRLVARGAQFHEDLVLADLELPAAPGRRREASVRVGLVSCPRAPLRPIRRQALEPLREIYEALVVGTRDYVRKNGFETVVLGLSGGIDSSLTACLAVDALGREHVVGVVMPSRFSSRQTQGDARRLARALGIRCEELSIEPWFTAALQTLQRLFAGRPADVTEQNLQARIRGTLLMALSNKFGWLVLTTGNKSEMATGYCTLYGDMAGGFAVIKDVPKTLVYQLARWRNRQGAPGPIPETVFRRPPTAELAPNQTDRDALPPYEALDPILKAYVEEDRSLWEILRRNRFNPKTVRGVIQMVDRSEYKRRQGPPGVKITPKAFGKDRRMPITNRYRQS
ncbi:MAG: NAD+ synthase [Candidatus Omnitrophica bacterium]|nr:NAD+ synthase [Candidatus Omnitrophota bacterium]